jgi:hypothetical protein
MELIKYPRTLHIEGSNLQKGDEDLKQISFEILKGKELVVEEKVDGSNTAISFDLSGNILLQSRGHFLEGKGDKKHFDPFKRFAHSIKERLWPILGSRFILYGEWLFAKHTIYYNNLNSFFQEFDIYDRENEIFLSTPMRHEMLLPTRPYLESVRVIKTGSFSSLEELLSLLGKSAFTDNDYSTCLQDLKKACKEAKAREDIELPQTDISGRMEGLYIKEERNGIVEGRYKWVRHQFTQTALNSGSHWDNRPLVKNKLKDNNL